MVSPVVGRAALPVSARASDVAHTLLHLPLASALDVAVVRRCQVSGVYSKLWELRAAGFADSMSLGWSRQRAARWWLTDDGLAVLGAVGGSWHDDWARCRLLERFPSVEWFYQVAGSLDCMGALEAFQWLDGISFDAAVRYARGWVALFWSGQWQSEKGMFDRLERLGSDLTACAIFDESAWPGLRLFVVMDEWQRELVYRAVYKHHLQDSSAVYCLADDSWSGSRTPGRSRGWVYQPPQLRDLGGWPWEKRVQRAFSSDSGGTVVGRVLDAVAEWPGMTLAMGRLALGEGGASRRAQNSCKWLVDAGLVDRRLDGVRYRYSLSSRGINLLARRDRVNYGLSRDRSHVLTWPDHPRLRAHEDGVMSLMGQFMEAGLSIAAGWRSWEHLGGGGAISPDGMVYLRHGPYGPGWHYVEYERSARGYRRVGRKLNGYLSPRRQDHWPVLVVAWDDRAEAVFWELARGGNLPMLTTNVRRLRESSAVGSTGCWSMYGLDVTIS